MKKFNNVILSSKAPSTNNIWLNNNVLKYYSANGWIPLTQTPEEKEEDNKEREKINKEIESIKNNYIKPLSTYESSCNWLIKGEDNDGIYYSNYLLDNNINESSNTYLYLKDYVNFKNTYFRVGNPETLSFMTPENVGIMDISSYASFLSTTDLRFYSSTGNILRIGIDQDDRSGAHFKISKYQHGGESLDWEISRNGVNLGGSGKVLLDNGTSLPLVAKIADLATSATLTDCINKINELLKGMRTAGILQS